MGLGTWDGRSRGRRDVGLSDAATRGRRMRELGDAGTRGREDLINKQHLNLQFTIFGGREKGII